MILVWCAGVAPWLRIGPAAVVPLRVGSGGWLVAGEDGGFACMQLPTFHKRIFFSHLFPLPVVITHPGGGGVLLVAQRPGARVGVHGNCAALGQAAQCMCLGRGPFSEVAV